MTCVATTALVAMARPAMAATTRVGRDECIRKSSDEGIGDPDKARPVYALAEILALPERREASATASATAGTSRLLNTEGTT